ncbi:MAG: ParB/RepB/Spo0J family partition protein [Polyangiaceae bacterium]
MNDPGKRRALGRGLDALLPVPPREGVTTSTSETRASAPAFLCPVEKIVPMKGQPRRHFAADALEELASSIREHGLLEPLVVRRRPGESDRFELIAGERRWRASQKAGLREVLVVVKDVPPTTAFELALIENVQREDLNAVELAEALHRLVEEHGYTQETLATRVGKDRSTIANALRLLKLPESVRNRVVDGTLSEGHARALLGLDTAAQIEEVAERAVRARLSVRAVEALVRAGKKDKAKRASEASGSEKSASVRDVETRLTRSLGTKVELRDKGNKGEIVIPYADLDALDRLLAKLA